MGAGQMRTLTPVTTRAFSVVASRSSAMRLPSRETQSTFASPLADSRRGMKYNLFPRLDFLAYLAKIHVAYHPGRERTEVARRLVMRMTAESTKTNFPQLQPTW